MDREQPLLPLDERFREAEQYAFDFEETRRQQPQPPDVEEAKSPCGRLGYCYCPKCNPK